MTTPSFPQASPLPGRTAVVTGASSGIGRAIALRLAAAGANVLVHARASESAALEVAQLVRAQGVASDVLLADLAGEEQCRSFACDAWDWKDGIDIWVNNAGADVLTGVAAEWSFERKLRQLWEVDVAGTISLSRSIGRRMANSKPAAPDRSILNIGWDQAETGMEGDSGEMFAAAKGAIMAFTRSLALSLAPEVRVNCVAPGWIRTRWGDAAPHYWHQRACREAALARWGTPDDVAEVALFLVSPAAGFMTGQVVPVNGGARRVADPIEDEGDLSG